MIRNGRTPTLVLIVLVLVIVVISYNHWSLSQKNLTLREALFLKEEKMNDLMEKKAYVEKQVGINSDKIKYFEERVEANTQALKQKDTEIDELNSKLRAKIQEYDKLLLDLNEARENLNTCKSEKDKLNESKNAEFSRLNEQIKQLNEQKNSPTNCNLENEVVLQNIISLIGKKLNQTDPKVLESILRTKFLPNEPIVQLSDKTQQTVDQQLRETKNVNENICLLPKLIGDCQNSTDRYFYDSLSQHCLIFSYSGCNGNSNNFLTLEECRLKCQNLVLNIEKTVQDKTTVYKDGLAQTEANLVINNDKSSTKQNVLN